VKYESQNRNLSWRWMSPEAIRDNTFTTAGDVWSFGVTLWEIMSLAASPYPGGSSLLSYGTYQCLVVDDHKLLEHLESGGRLEQPVGCPPAVYDVMMACWDSHPDARPVCVV
jgi:serine/threonine protein kinase